MLSHEGILDSCYDKIMISRKQSPGPGCLFSVGCDSGYYGAFLSCITRQILHPEIMILLLTHIHNELNEFNQFPLTFRLSSQVRAVQRYLNYRMKANVFEMAVLVII